MKKPWVDPSQTSFYLKYEKIKNYNIVEEVYSGRYWKEHIRKCEVGSLRYVNNLRIFKIGMQWNQGYYCECIQLLLFLNLRMNKFYFILFYFRDFNQQRWKEVEETKMVMVKKS